MIGLLLVALVITGSLSVLNIPTSVSGVRLVANHTLPASPNPGNIAVNTRTNIIYVISRGNFSSLTGGVLQRINGTDGSPISGIELNGTADAMAVDPNSNTIFVSVGAYPKSILAINGTTGGLERSLSLGDHGYYVDLAVDSTLDHLYATTFNYSSSLVSGFTNTMVVIDMNTFKVVQNLTLGDSPAYVSVDQITHRVYVVGGNPWSGILMVIDGTSGKLLANVTIGRTGGGRAMVNSATNRIYVGGGEISPVFVIDGATNRVVANVSVGGAAWFSDGVTVDPYTNVVYAVSTCVFCVPEESGLFAINGTTNTIIANDTFTGLERGITELTVDPNTHMVYVSGPGDTITIVGGFGSIEPPRTLVTQVGRGIPPAVYPVLPASTLVLVLALGCVYVYVRRSRGRRPNLALQIPDQSGHSLPARQPPIRGPKP